MSDRRIEEGAATDAKAPRRPWTTPTLRTMRAGSAEAGPNPNAPEGPIARGS